MDNLFAYLFAGFVISGICGSWAIKLKNSSELSDIAVVFRVAPLLPIIFYIISVAFPEGVLGYEKACQIRWYKGCDGHDFGFVAASGRFLTHTFFPMLAVCALGAWLGLVYDRTSKLK
jgi:hypothetical protein